MRLSVFSEVFPTVVGLRSNLSDGPTGPPRVVVHVGAEGGSIRLIAQPLTSGWRYRCTILDQTDLWLEDDAKHTSRQSCWAYDWPAALRLLDRYPWPNLHPKAVNGEFATLVVEAALSRLDANAGISRASNQRAIWTKFLLL